MSIKDRDGDYILPIFVSSYQTHTQLIKNIGFHAVSLQVASPSKPSAGQLCRDTTVPPVDSSS